MPPRKERIDVDGKPFTVRVLRVDPRGAEGPRFARYVLTARRGMTVLEALTKIQEEQDPTLVFRYSCRGAVCGSCGMVINGHPDLACRTLLESLPSSEVLLEPLPHLEILKDLIVDMEPFWSAYRAIEPYLMAAGPVPAAGHRVTPENRARIDAAVNCILCACCYGACPAVGRDARYLGPAALAKLDRFVSDSRDARDLPEALRKVDHEAGVWGCDTIFRCVDACPKQVRPVDGIESLRRRLVVTRLAGIFGRPRRRTGP
jgi:succinate dehydrogenase / fumarate reductase, iron-sulfur subunit